MIIAQLIIMSTVSKLQIIKTACHQLAFMSSSSHLYQTISSQLLKVKIQMLSCKCVIGKRRKKVFEKAECGAIIGIAVI